MVGKTAQKDSAHWGRPRGALAIRKRAGAARACLGGPLPDKAKKGKGATEDGDWHDADVRHPAKEKSGQFARSFLFTDIFF